MLPVIEPPMEPKLAYPEPLLVSADLMALIRGSTFFAATHQGDLVPPGAPHIGLFHNDTRFLSHFELRINEAEPLVLSSTTVGADNSRVELTAKGGPITGGNLDIPINNIYVHREQILDKSHFYDVLDFQNFHDGDVTIKVEISFAADFMDIFQVRGILRGKSGRYYQPVVEDSNVIFRYEGLDRRRRVTKLTFDPRPHSLNPDRVSWQCSLAPRGRTRLATRIAMLVSDLEDQTRFPETSPTFDEIHTHSTMQYEEWRRACTRFRSDNKIFDSLLQTSIKDFYALGMPDRAGTAIAAGVPWFAALFGRDSLLSSYETLILNPGLARGTLLVLASYQGLENCNERDETPGKILHERRSGEMTATNEIPFGRSYGSVDATPLFLILAHEYLRWTGDKALLHELKEALIAATRWILEHGDLDGDGLIEYCRQNPKGLLNQGWKDSGDAYRHSHGQIAKAPMALVEVQGYAVRALAAASELLKLLNEEELGMYAMKRSNEIRTLLESQFWLQDRDYYAMALDRDKMPLRVDGSNPGHLLFSRAISTQRASQVANRLLSDSLFSGWGIRTLSSAERYFNPMSYHCGSVWPHDNAMIGYGMARYGFHQQSSTIFQSLYDAALHFRDYRLPELFCGVERLAKSEPVHYPVSCSPQAWAAGAPFLLMTGLLGLRPSAGMDELAIVDPYLPPFLGRLRLDNLRVGSSRLSLEFQREKERTYCNVADIEGGTLKISIVFASASR